MIKRQFRAQDMTRKYCRYFITRLSALSCLARNVEVQKDFYWGQYDVAADQTEYERKREMKDSKKGWTTLST